MKARSNNGMIGAVMIGAGIGLATAGLMLIVPVCMDWSASLFDQAVRRGRESVGNAAAAVGDFAGHAQTRFGEAAKTARGHASKAAGAVETAARHVREYTS